MIGRKRECGPCAETIATQLRLSDGSEFRHRVHACEQGHDGGVR